jgi:hypothetical protein
MISLLGSLLVFNGNLYVFVKELHCLIKLILILCHFTSPVNLQYDLRTGRSRNWVPFRHQVNFYTVGS